MCVFLNVIAVAVLLILPPELIVDGRPTHIE